MFDNFILGAQVLFPVGAGGYGGVPPAAPVSVAAPLRVRVASCGFTLEANLATRRREACGYSRPRPLPRDPSGQKSPLGLPQ
ncbi:MAG: hypothetical protein M1582_04420, partial [Actinobacteria bacterium]|nr:hypothetical protein [Actinomycetota bacterium]